MKSVAYLACPENLISRVAAKSSCHPVFTCTALFTLSKPRAPTPSGRVALGMPPPILSSEVITLPVLETMLNSHQAQKDKTYRLLLLRTKLALLTNPPPPSLEVGSSSTRASVQDQLIVLRLRLEIGRLILSLPPGTGTESEIKGARVELGIVDKEIKGILKRLVRLREREQAGTTGGGGDMEDLGRDIEAVTSLRGEVVGVLGDLDRDREEGYMTGVGL